MNSLKILTAGESHGQALVAILEGLPAGFELSAADINYELARRQQGFGRGGRMKIEKDKIQILAGVRGGKTLGSPLAFLIPNRDWVDWQKIMSVTPAAGKIEAVTLPRPGHADLAGAIKYQQKDIRNIIERASARETAARVAAGAAARKFLDNFAVKIFSQVIQIGPVKMSRQMPYQQIPQLAERSPVRCSDKAASAEMVSAIKEAAAREDSLGGIFEVIITGLPIGLGSYISWEKRLDAQLASALMSIPAIKGVEIGGGFALAALPGSRVHDAIYYNSRSKKFYRQTNRAGGLEGGITNGEPLIIRAAMKPIATLGKALPSVDLKTKKSAAAHRERADVCAVPAAAVVGEAMAALILADAWREKFGGDSLIEVITNFENFKKLCYNA